MASLAWFRDLLMLAFSLLLLVITGLLALRLAASRWHRLDGYRSLLPLSLIMIATICMMWTLRHWTTISLRRAVLSLVISLSASWITALACVEGMARREGVFLRTSKSDGRRTIFTALKLTRWETAMAAALYLSTGLLASLKHPPWLLVFIVFVQATVYLCGPIAAVWNLGTQSVPRTGAPQQLRRSPRARRAPRGWGWVLLPRPARRGPDGVVRRGRNQRLRSSRRASARYRH